MERVVRIATFHCLLLLCLPSSVPASTEIRPLTFYNHVVGREIVHSVQPGDTIDRVSRRFGVKQRAAMGMNQISPKRPLKKGQRLTLSNRRIIPLLTNDGIVVNLADLTLTWVSNGILMAQFPVGVGRETWETPVGHYEILSRRRDPVWNVPPSIQREMQEKGQVVKTKVPPGPDNPLGKYWLQLSAGGIGIHGTNRPWTVGKYATHGCLRMRADDIEWLYYNVPNGTTVDIIDEPVKFARLEDGRLLVEAHPLRKNHTRHFDAKRVAARLEASGLGDVADVRAVEQAMRNAWGVAVDVTRPGVPMPAVATEPLGPGEQGSGPRLDPIQDEPRAAAPDASAGSAPAPPMAVAIEESRQAPGVSVR